MKHLVYRAHVVFKISMILIKVGISVDVPFTRTVRDYIDRLEAV